MENEIVKVESNVRVKNDAVRIPIGKLRDNPWIVSTIVLGLILILIAAFSISSRGSGDVVSSDVAAQNLVSFIEGQSTDPLVKGNVEVVSIKQDGSLYQVTLNYQGQQIPVFVSSDGRYLLTDVIPLDSKLGNIRNNSTGENMEPVNVELGESPFKGDENSTVTIVEFSDFQCPFCGKFYTDSLALIEKNYIDTGKVKLVYKDFPLSNIHPQAQKAAEAARCVGSQLGDKGYFEMHNKLFENQESLSIENYKKWARGLKVNGAKFDKCLDDGEFASAVKADFDYGTQLGVTGTPAFFINGKIISGAQPYSVFEQIIEAELAGDA